MARRIRPLPVVVIVAALAWIFPAPAHPCSIFAASEGDLVLASNNEDYMSAGNDTAVLFMPPDDGHFGYVVVGYSLFDGRNVLASQGGANDQGLFLDINAVPYLEARTNPHGSRITGWGLFARLLESCSTVQEALDMLGSFNLAGIIERCKIFIADRHGDAAIFEGTWVTHKTGGYLISTNYYESNPGLGWYPCWRHDVIDQVLSNGSPLSIDLMVQAADAAHQGTSVDDEGITFYTNVHDLNTNLFRLYYKLDYENFLVFDLDEELALGGGLYLMADLFGEPETDDFARISFHTPAFRLPFRLPIIVRDAGANLDPAARDQVQVLVSTPAEPAGELVVLHEIRADLGVFAGGVWADPGTPAADDGILQGSPRQTVTATYHDPDDGSGAAAEVKTHAILWCDLDGDGADSSHCGGEDCHDFQADVGPHATEFCDLEDDDCDGEVDAACTTCGDALEIDVTAAGGVVAANPLECGTCVLGDFAEAPYGDEGTYRYWIDAFEIEADAGDSFAASVFREAPDGILEMALLDEDLNGIDDDGGLGWFQHRFEESGTFYLLLFLQRVDHSNEPNAYRLELHCPGFSGPWTRWPDASSPRGPSSRVSQASERAAPPDLFRKLLWDRREPQSPLTRP